MNRLSTEKRKVYQFSLTKESEDILRSFTEKYGTSKSIVIERALQYLAASYHRKIYLQYTIIGEDQKTTTTTTQNSNIYNETVKKHNERINKIDDTNISDEELEDIINDIEKHKIN